MDPVTGIGLAAGLIGMCATVISSVKTLVTFFDKPLKEEVERLEITIQNAQVSLKELDKLERKKAITYRDERTGEWTPIGLNLNGMTDCIRECDVYLKELESKIKPTKLFKGSDIKKKLSTFNDALDKAYRDLSAGALTIEQFQQLHQGIL